MTPSFALFCNPESRRVEGFCAAMGKVIRERPILVPWYQVLQADNWHHILTHTPRFLRLESPGRNWKVEKQLMQLGATIEDEESGRPWRRFALEAVEKMENNPGEILSQRQWFLGWRQLNLRLSQWADVNGYSNRWLCPPDDVIRMFDKAECQRAFDNAGIPIAPALGIPESFDELWEMMRASGRRRVFLKPCHGSSGSGVVAIESISRDVQAFSTVEMAVREDGPRLFNRRRIEAYRGSAKVRGLVDAICRERCLAQAWIPKAGLQGRSFDVRIVVIGGRARQIMIRLGQGPITSSQLRGGKGDAGLLRERMGPLAWTSMLELCEKAMCACFPRCLYAGFDVLVEPNFRTAHLLEVNAFGDLLPGVLHEGRDTYEWEASEAVARARGQVSTIGA